MGVLAEKKSGKKKFNLHKVLKSSKSLKILEDVVKPNEAKIAPFKSYQKDFCALRI